MTTPKKQFLYLLTILLTMSPSALMSGSGMKNVGKREDHPSPVVLGMTMGKGEQMGPEKKLGILERLRVLEKESENREWEEKIKNNLVILVLLVALGVGWWKGWSFSDEKTGSIALLLILVARVVGWFIAKFILWFKGKEPSLTTPVDFGFK